MISIVYKKYSHQPEVPYGLLWHKDYLGRLEDAAGIDLYVDGYSLSYAKEIAEEHFGVLDEEEWWVEGSDNYFLSNVCNISNLKELFVKLGAPNLRFGHWECRVILPHLTKAIEFDEYRNRSQV